jgi:hypothetical protein
VLNVEKITNLELGFRDEIKFHLETMINDNEYYDEQDIEKMANITEQEIIDMAKDLLYNDYLSEIINNMIENRVRNIIGVDYL